MFTCPGCGYPTNKLIGGYEVCLVCNWEDDGQDDPKADEIRGGPNSDLSLTENRLWIGKELLRLTKNLKGTINLDPVVVLCVLENRKAIELSKRTLEMKREEYIQLHEDTRVALIHKP